MTNFISLSKLSAQKRKVLSTADRRPRAFPPSPNSDRAAKTITENGHERLILIIFRSCPFSDCK